jgi:hypothetical protein
MINAFVGQYRTMAASCLQDPDMVPNDSGFIQFLSMAASSAGMLQSMATNVGASAAHTAAEAAHSVQAGVSELVAEAKAAAKDVLSAANEAGSADAAGDDIPMYSRVMDDGIMQGGCAESAA